VLLVRVVADLAAEVRALGVERDHLLAFAAQPDQTEPDLVGARPGIDLLADHWDRDRLALGQRFELAHADPATLLTGRAQQRIEHVLRAGDHEHGADQGAASPEQRGQKRAAAARSWTV
jgi:hypothetical protein